MLAASEAKMLGLPLPVLEEIFTQSVRFTQKLDRPAIVKFLLKFHHCESPFELLRL